MRVRLEVTKGPAAGKLFTFEEPDIFVFGRGNEAHYSLPSDRTISRNHFMIQLQPPDCLVVDLKSSNGTIVNNTRYGGVGGPPVEGMRQEKPRTVRLRDGDEITAGKTVFCVGITGGDKLDKETLLMGIGDGLFETGPQDEPILLEPAGPGDAAVTASTEDETPPDGGRVLGDLRGAPKPPPVEGYEYLKVLGVGGQGAVYLARETEGGKPVAIKTLLPNVAEMPAAVAVFEREASIGMRIGHPNVVRVYRNGRIKNVFYFVMEYVEGIDVKMLVEKCGGRVPFDEAMTIALDALAGLSHAHGMKIVHRDLKPANILLGGERPGWTVKLADFGLAKSFEQAGLSGLTMEGDICGSLMFMPREQLLNYKWVKPVSDVYSMSATLYHMLTGKPVRKGLEHAEDAPSAIAAVMNEPVVPMRERLAGDGGTVPAPVAAVVDRSLSDDAEARYLDAGAMRQALVKALG